MGFLSLVSCSNNLTPTVSVKDMRMVQRQSVARASVAAPITLTPPALTMKLFFLLLGSVISFGGTLLMVAYAWSLTDLCQSDSPLSLVASAVEAIPVLIGTNTASTFRAFSHPI